MKSADSVEREEMHLRQIEMRGFRRSDGLYEVEGRLIDRKPQAFTPPNGGRHVLAGMPIHNLGVRLVFDAQMLVHDVQTFTDDAPHPLCSDGGHTLQALKGLHIASGWNQEVRKRLDRSQTCTHLRELLIPLATTALQSMATLRMREPDRLDAAGRPIKIDSCYAYNAESEVVQQRWPQFHRPAPPDAA
jgi:Protein of unknown function (DUF2889)